MRIRNVDIGYGLTLAPMAGVTDRTFRMLCRRQDADYVVSEMISAKAIATATEKLRSLRASERTSIPLHFRYSAAIRR